MVRTADNDLYTGVMAQKHPWGLGLPAKVAWAEIWEDLSAMANTVMAGETVFVTDHALHMTRTGKMEETCPCCFLVSVGLRNGGAGLTRCVFADHTFSYTPFRSLTGEVLGIRNFSYE